ncbi:MAG: multidrug efflux RND transporter permease subunit [Rhodospirillaceae bacterium]|nr:multidrug efflux RND transporter permease subunit [Rhodospirillaceae bacterium]
MKFSHFFVDRPIFTGVLSILIMLIGSAAYFALPVSQYPEVAPPNIVVTASYPGASAEVVANAVAAPLEQEINGVEGMLYMLSQSTADGLLTITVTFELGTDLDMAQVLVQNRVAIAQPRLPEEVQRLGVNTKKNSPDLMMVVHIVSPDRTYDQLYLSNFASLRVKDVLGRIDGIGDVQIFGARDYSMRVWLDPDRISSLGLTAGDVVSALRAQNIQVASGVLNQPPMPDPGAFQLNVQTLGRLSAPEQFGEVIVKTDDQGRLIRVSDIARVEIGARDYMTNSYLNGQEAVAMVIFQRPGSNALATAAEIRRTMDSLAAEFPKGVEYRVVYNPTEFIQQSVDAVTTTIFEAIALVVIVVFVFLQTWRAAVIPIVAIPVSLVGTFAVMAAFGFSLNTLSLFGLVLAIGIVVDDAIVVVENVERHIEGGMAPKDAAHRTMDEVGGALVSIALVLAAVFVPTAMVPGITGEFYRQFALTIAVATLISCFVSLTLSPALSGILLKAKNQHGHGSIRGLDAFFATFNRAIERLSSGYGRTIRRLVRMSAIVMVGYGGLLALTWGGFAVTPGGFVPAQDQGYLIVAIQLPPGSSLQRTDAVVQRVNDQLLATRGVINTVAFAGFSGATFTNDTSAAAIFAGLDSFDNRQAQGIGYDQLVGEIRGKLFGIEEAFVFVIPPPPIQGIGNGGGFKMMVQDRAGRGPEALKAATQELAAAANQTPGLVGVFSFFDTSNPQIYVDIDRAKAEMLGVPVNNVFEALSVYLGSAFVNDFNLFGRTYQVRAQADSEFRRTAEDIANLRTRNAAGDMVPLGAVATFADISAPYRVPRYNLYPAAELQGDRLPGFSSGQALATMEDLAQRVLPAGFGYDWTELAYQEKNVGGSAALIFVFAVVVVFLVLAAQYESWTLPLAVILIVPMCLLASLAGLLLRGMDNDIMTQIGFVVLVGLACKNAILIVEFAAQAERDGADRIEAAAQAGRTRLRPILMTSFAFILGVVPLMIAEGAGAEMRQALGTAVFSGMLGVTLFGLILTPVFFTLCRRLSDLGHSIAGSGAPPAKADGHEASK